MIAQHIGQEPQNASVMPVVPLITGTIQVQTTPFSPKKDEVLPLKNTLYYGDNLEILRDKVRDETVDLCYIDPPFNSQRTYNQIYNNIGRDRANEQAFLDTWTWNDSADDGLSQIKSNHLGRFTRQTIELIIGLYNVLGRSSLMGYLINSTLRIAEINRVLKPTGSFYLHCDPNASHYLKLIVDSVFIPNGGDFKNEVIWRRTGSHNSSKRYGPIHDTIFFYTRSAKDFYVKRTYRSYLKGHIEQYFKKTGERGLYWGNALTGAGTRNGESGKPWKHYDPTQVRRHWAVPKRIAEELQLDPELTTQEKLTALDEFGFIEHPRKGSSAMPTYRQYLSDSPGMPLQDIWSYQPHTKGVLWNSDAGIDEDVKWLNAQGDSERIGFPTQKPEGLLERIITSSSRDGDVVLDACCGCGTTSFVAQNLNRKWIGIDITYYAIATILSRFEDEFGPSVVEGIHLDGIPKDMASARALANRRDDRVRKEFEKWAILTYTKHRAVVRKKKGADAGIDGVYFFWNGLSNPGKMILQAKSGAVQRKDIAALRGDMEREHASLACLITLEDSTKPMRDEAKAAGIYENPERNIKCDRIRIIQVEDLIHKSERVELQTHLEAFNKAKLDADGAQMRLDLRSTKTIETEVPAKKEVASTTFDRAKRRKIGH